jgi:succinoglycan biosynthesis transport protein ExoP
LAAPQASTLSEYVRILARRKAIVLIALVLVPAAAYVVSLLQDPLYESKAQVLLNRQSLASTLAGTTDPTVFQDAERVVQTQAKLAAVPAVAERTVAAVSAAGLTASELLASSSVQPEPNVDLLEFTVRHERPGIASRLATTYAREYTRYRTLVETRALVQARNDVRERITELQASGATGAVVDDLLAKEQQLLTLETLQTGNASVVRASGTAEQVQPLVMRNVALGLVLGLGLGLLLAFVADALDTRIRSGDEVAAALGLTLLGRLPPPARAARRVAEPEMLVDPGSPAAEAFRMLRTNVDFANLDVHAKSIMVTSSVEGEGKSTTVANLAVAYAMTGKRVVLVDLDLRRPSLRRFFELGRGAGITDVALGDVPLRKALAPVPVPGLLVLQAGTPPPNPGEFVGSQALRDVLVQLGETADIVLVDAPPLLQVGDAMTLSSAVDAVIALTRLKTLRRGILDDLRRALDQMPANVLGFVVTDAKEGVGYGYGTYTPPRGRGRGGRGLFGRRDAGAAAASGAARDPRTRVRSL